MRRARRLLDRFRTWRSRWIFICVLVIAATVGYRAVAGRTPSFTFMPITVSLDSPDFVAGKDFVFNVQVSNVGSGTASDATFTGGLRYVLDLPGAGRAVLAESTLSFERQHQNLIRGRRGLTVAPGQRLWASYHIGLSESVLEDFWAERRRVYIFTNVVWKEPLGAAGALRGCWWLKPSDTGVMPRVEQYHELDWRRCSDDN